MLDLYEIQIERFMNEKIQLQVLRFNRVMKLEKINLKGSKHSSSINLNFYEDEDEESEFSLKRIKLVSKKMKKLKSKKHHQIQNNFNSSIWNLQENIRYRKFLMHNSQFQVMSKFQRKSLKVNVKMSRAVQTRTAEQCRSHHQKMLKYHRSNEEIIEFIGDLMKNEKQLENQVVKIQEQKSKINGKLKNELIQFKTESSIKDEDLFVPMIAVEEFNCKQQNFDQFWESILCDRQISRPFNSQMF